MKPNLEIKVNLEELTENKPVIPNLEGEAYDKTLEEENNLELENKFSNGLKEPDKFPNKNEFEKLPKDNLIPQFQKVNLFGDCINALSESENPFYKEMKEINENKKDSISILKKRAELKEKMEEYAINNPESKFAKAFATDYQTSDFAKANPDLIMNDTEKAEFIKDEKNSFDAISSIIDKLKEKYNKDFSQKYGGNSRSDEMQKLTEIMDDTVAKKEATVIEMKNGSQLLLDPTREGGLNIYSIDGDENELIASFDEDGNDLIGNAQGVLANCANDMAIDNDGFFGNIIDMMKDSKINTTPSKQVETAPENMLLTAFETIKKNGQEK